MHMLQCGYFLVDYIGALTYLIGGEHEKIDRF